MNEEKLKHYFLGKLSEAEGETLEEEVALSAELTETAQIVESELIDDYLRGNLSATNRELFETIYLTTEARREKLLITKSLWRVANEHQTTKLVTAESPLSFWQIWNVRQVAFVGIPAILLVGAGVFLLGRLIFSVWFSVEVLSQQNSNQPLMQVTNEPLNRTNENHNAQPIEKLNSVNLNLNNSSLQRNKNAVPTPAPKVTQTPNSVKQSAPTLANFTVLPGTLRDEGEQFIKIEPATQKINLRLNLPHGATKYHTYSAILKTADGETVLTASNLKSFSFTLPAGKLENRTYIIFLEGQNDQNPPEAVSEYTFRVRR